jgi:hypothetical protein
VGNRVSDAQLIEIIQGPIRYCGVIIVMEITVL